MLLSGWDLLCAADDGKHVHLVRLDVVDGSKGPFPNFPDLWDPEFRDLPPPIRGSQQSAASSVVDQFGFVAASSPRHVAA